MSFDFVTSVFVDVPAAATSPSRQLHKPYYKGLESISREDLHISLFLKFTRAACDPLLRRRLKTFSSFFSTLKGGYASGFRHVKPEEYKPRLLHFCKEGKITYMRQVKYSKQSVHSGDVFILDLGDHAYQFNGATCSAFEKSAVSATFLFVLIYFESVIILTLCFPIGCRFPARFGE